MKKRSIYLRGVAATTLFSFVLTSCGSKGNSSGGSDPGSAAPPPKDTPVKVVPIGEAPEGLDLRLATGKQGAPAFDRATLAPAKKLGDGEAQALLARAKPLAVEPADKQAFALRGKSQPPPRTGTTVTGAFPPPASSLLPPAANDAGKPLTVLRWMPEGAVPLAPELSVTFSQPMVAVTSQGDAAASTPVKLTPQPAGAWRWIGTRTALFDPAVRFPQATTYKVEIPAGTKSATGAALAKGTTFSFETPPATVVSEYPTSGPYRLDVPMFLLFDQKIDPANVLAKLKVTAGSQAYPLALLTPAEIEKDKVIKGLVDAAKANEQDGRWLAFRSTRAFAPDSGISLEVPVGTPSAEGPNLTKTAQSYTFRTYPPLEIVEARCGWEPACRPGAAFSIRFNNPLDATKFDPQQITIEPPIPGARVMSQGTTVMILGMTASRTVYKVGVAASIRDEFGQTLGKSAMHTFRVGDAEPTFFGPQGMVVLDPLAKAPTLDFFSVNYPQLKVRLYQVTPADYDAYSFYEQNRWNHDKPPRVPGKLVFDQLVKTATGKNDLVETHVDLGPALTNGLGQVLAIVEPHPWKESYEPPTLVSWVQATKIGLDAYVDHDELHAFATELATGKPKSGVTLEIAPFGITGKSDDQGLATLALAVTNKTGSNLLLARDGADLAIVAEPSSWYSGVGSWVKQTPGKDLAWYVIDDRRMYKPGEEVSLKGWIRTIDRGKGGDVAGIAGAVTGVSYKVTDSLGNQIGTGTAAVSPVGGFDTKFTIPKMPNLGGANISFETQGAMRGAYSHWFQIEEFRRPEFEVSAQASQGPFLVGGSGDVTVTAKYYAGGPLAGTAANWYVTANQTSFTPPNRDDYIFGAWEPWWERRGRYEDDDGGYRGGRPSKSWNLEGKTDATGAHTLHLDFLSANPAVPMSVTTNASVTDVNRQTWTASAALIVHPASQYVGLKVKKPFVEAGTPFDLDVIGVDLDGKAVANANITVKSVRLDWEYVQGRYQTKEVDPQTCDVKACSFATKEGGTYQVTATIIDPQGRPNTTKLTFWVSGGKQPPEREVVQQVVQLIPDKKEYSAGNTAELLVRTPFFPAEGVVSWRRSGIVKSERITMTGPTTVLKVPITDAMTPNLFVQVDLVGAAERTNDKGDPDPALPKRPAYAVGQIDLPIPPKQRTLNVVVEPSAAKVGPGESATLAVTVRDAAGKPVNNAEAAVIVVDEAILALAGYTFPNPIDTFYAERDEGTRDVYSRAYVKLAKPDVTRLAANQAPDAGAVPADATVAMPASIAEAPKMEAKADAPARSRARWAAKGGDMDEETGAQPKAIAVRSDFNPLAAFSPAVHTDGNGRASVPIKVPDNLTRYRIIAVATAGENQFGKGESALTARLPLMVRPSPPRFLNFGDTFELPVVVQNQTDAPMTVKLAARTTNAALTAGAGREVTVPANDRVEVRFPAAAEMAGTARFQLVGSAGGASDAAEVALPVWTPATTEAFATYGVIDEGATKQPVALPGSVVTQFGGLEVTTASTNLQALTDAMLYLVHYPYECAEQRSSRVLAVAALKDVLAAFKTKDMPSAAAMTQSVAADIERLSQMQNGDGGFAYWDRGHPSEPYLTVYVASALGHARDKGFVVPANIIEQAKQYLRQIESHYPAYYGPEIRHTISAYALYTRKQLGDLDVAKAQKLYAEAGGAAKLSMEANGWLLGTLAGQPAAKTQRDAIVRHALNKVSETAGAANFTTGYGDGGYLLLASDHRVDAVMLESLIQEQPTLDLIPKVVTGLLAHRKAGRWLNTQENTFALLALDRYFQTYEKVTPDFVARVWLGNDYAGDLAFKGRTTDYFQINIPMKDVATHDKQDLTIQKDGAGRLYYRIGMTYAPSSLSLAAADYGFVVQRRYEGADDPKDVTRDASGAWHIKAGARVRVKLTMVNENRRYHVALVDPLPAGLEAMNPALAVTGPIPLDPNEDKSRGAYWWWYGPWYDHQNLRDERTEAFTPLLWEGVHAYEYVARATTPGNFVVPPTKAEEMYMPETFGRSASDRVIVE